MDWQRAGDSRHPAAAAGQADKSCEPGGGKMRQRTIVDSEFWCSNQLINLTTEDRMVLIYLLTSTFSNIIGVYELVPRVAAAQIGWTEEQLAQVLRRLIKCGLIDWDEQSGFVWVKIWWKHNVVRQISGPKLRARALEQIEAMPLRWRQDFLSDLQQKGVNMISRPADTVSISYPPGAAHNSSSSGINKSSSNSSSCLRWPGWLSKSDRVLIEQELKKSQIEQDDAQKGLNLLRQSDAKSPLSCVMNWIQEQQQKASEHQKRGEKYFSNLHAEQEQASE